MDALEGKVIVVVGGGRGIGRASALCAASEGARVVVADNGAGPDGGGGDPGVAEQVAAEIRASGGTAQAFTTDVRDAAQIKSLIADVRALHQGIDGLFLCAGLGLERPILRTTDEELDRVLALHVQSTFRCVREFGRVLVDQRRGGSILLCAGAEGVFGAAQRSALAAASGAIIGLTRSAALELRRHQVRLNALVPTARTRLTEGWPLFASIRADSLTPEHVARVAAFLLSDAAQTVHGETVGVAGGRVYGLRVSETPGVYFEGPPVDVDTLGERFADSVRSA